MYQQDRVIWNKCTPQTREDFNPCKIICEIYDLIKQLYGSEFTGKVEVHKTPTGYLLILGFPSNDYYHYTFSVDGTEEQFLALVKEELKINKYQFTTFRHLELENGQR